MEPLSHRWYLRLTRRKGKALPSPLIITEWLKKMTRGMVVKESARDGLCCCVCWEGSCHNPRIKDHSALSCPLIASFNKVRKGVRLTDAYTGSMGLLCSKDAAPFNTDAEIKKLMKKVVDMEAKQAQTDLIVADLKKLNLSEEGKPPKRKAEEAGPSSRPPKKQKRSGRGRGKGKRKGGQLGAQSGAGVGKGKQRQGPPPPPNSTNVPSGVVDWED